MRNLYRFVLSLKLFDRLVLLTVVPLIIFLTLISYKDINKLYYLNDEWIALGNVLANGLFAGISNYSLPELLLGKGRPLTFLISNFFYNFYPYNVIPFIITAYFFHSLNGILMYVIVRKISKNILIAFVSALFFTTASISSQSIVWIPNIPQDLIAFTFILLSQILMLKYFDNLKKIYVYFSILSAYMAFLFKDAYFYVFIWLPILYILLTGNKNNIKNFLNKYWYLIIVICSVIIYKLIILYGPNILTPKWATISLFLKSIFNFFYYPLVTLSQTFIPAEYMFKTARKFLYFNYDNLTPFITNIDAISQNIISDILSILLSLVFIIVLSFSYILNKKQRKTIIYAAVFYVLSFSTISIYLINRGTSYIESRYLYVSMLSMGMFVGVIVDTLKNWLHKISKVSAYIFIILILAVYIIKQITLIQREVRRSVIFGQNTKNVLIEFSKILPNLPTRSVILLTGNKTYYNYSNLPVPLQLNPGYILMIWYYKNNHIPKEMLNVDKKLWSFGSQWYEEYNNKAFGYYWDKTLLLKEIINNKFSVDQVISLYYDGNSNILINNTFETRNSLLNLLNSK